MSSSKPKNSFKALQHEEEALHHYPTENIKEQLDENLGFIQMFGQIMELYLPKVFEMLVSLTGASTEKSAEPSAYPSFYDTDDTPAGSAKTSSSKNDTDCKGD